MSLFVRLAMHTYGDDSFGHAPISPVLFVLEQGVIKDAMFPPVDTPTKRWWKLWG
jgi:hypothetical protein